MRCAERTGSAMMLWQHEFYMVMEPDPGKPSGCPLPYVYQAVEFKLGSNLDPKEVEWAKKKQQQEVWVCGVAYAPAFHVRKFNHQKMREGYLFHTEWNDVDADTALFGNCPEVVRVDNCLAWRPMSVVMQLLPRVVHFKDVKVREIHVAGRDLHFVCGVCAMENVGNGTFSFKKIRRASFYMYPEDALGGVVQSSSIMWEQIESLFDGIRGVMQRNGNSRSGSFGIPWAACCMLFLEVRSLYCTFLYDLMYKYCVGYVFFFATCIKSLTEPDKKVESVVERKAKRLDANLGYQNVAYDMDRVILTYSSR